MKNVKNKKTLIISLIVIAVVAIIFGLTYAFLATTVNANRKVVLKAGTLDLILDEKNEITISDALPMYDEVGIIQEEKFNFSLVNNTSQTNDYTLKLVKIEGTNELDPAIVKYGLIKEGNTTIATLSTLIDGVIDKGTIVGDDTIDYELRLWIDNSVTDLSAIQGKSLSYKIVVEASTVDEEATATQVTFAGITKEVNETVDKMFNYTNEGKYYDYANEEELTDTNYVTNGIYAMDDDDGVSYYYRGEVDNLVQFGEYTKDYEVYRYVDGENTYDFVSLDACKYYNSSCTEDNKVTKYTAGTPMYWKIIRVNGDKSIRMIYAGTTTDATGYETGIGLSRYNEEYDDPKYTGYTYDRTTTETKSDAKNEIDTWYANVLEGTTYDEKIVETKFCSDSSGYESGFTDMWGDEYDLFATSKRLNPRYYNLENDTTPTFKCAETTESYGGSYSLKVGLITYDEILAAGGNYATNNSYYLYNGTKGSNNGKWYWSMSPAAFVYGDARVGFVLNHGYADIYHVYSSYGLLCPVINLSPDVVFKDGTDGSITTPYEVE